MTDEKNRRVKGKLQQSKSKLDNLLHVTNAINDNSSEEELLSILKSSLTENLNIAKLALFTFDSGNWKVAITDGIDVESCSKIDINALIETFQDIGTINNNNSNEALQNFEVAIPVFHKERPLAFMLLADIDEEKMEISPIIRHLRFIQTLINIIVVALENKRLYKQEIKQAAINKELELARNMQTLLFPKELPNSDLISVKAVYLPHSEVGGDYYDVIQLSNNRLALCIADVSGKGISAALLMANFQANLRALINVASSLEELIQLCNQKVIESANFEKFITLFVGIYEPNQNELTYINCGHQPPILQSTGNVSYLRTGSTILGMFEELPSLQTSTISINKNDQLICFTDGLSEIIDADGNYIDAEGIATVVQKKKTLNETMSALSELVKKNKNIDALDDDITCLAAQFL